MTNFEKIKTKTSEEMEQFLIKWLTSPKYRIVRASSIKHWLENEVEE